MRRVAIVSSASANGKTTVGRQLAEKLGVPFVELDALVHGPDWSETPNEQLRQTLAPILRSDGWVIDGSYERKFGSLVLDAADTIAWLDLPIRVWFPRLVARTIRRFAGREHLWNGNRESFRSVVWGPRSLFVLAFRMHFYRRRNWPKRFAGYPVVRLTSTRAVARWLSARQGPARPASAQPAAEVCQSHKTD